MTGKQAANLNPLKREMQAQRIGVNQLAAKTGIAPRLIVKYRVGDSTPRDYFGVPTPNALKIASVLRADVDELFPPRITKEAA